MLSSFAVFVNAGSPTSDVKCASCLSGTFSTTVMLSSVNHTHSKMQMERKTHYLQIHTHAYGLFVFFSVRCEGRSVLRLGDSKTDTLCEMTSPASTTTTLLQSSSKHPQPRQLNHMEETTHMNTTSTTSLPPLSSMTHSSLKRLKTQMTRSTTTLVTMRPCH